MKPCRVCGNVFKRTNNTQKYCSEKCETEAHTRVFGCEWCKQPFTRKVYGSRKYRFCGHSCSNKYKRSLSNPMDNEISRLKMIETLKTKGFHPKIRGGNGRGMTEAQEALLNALGIGWVPELAVTLLQFREQGYPNHYKIDVAHPDLKIAVEVDGKSHNSRARKLQDLKKEQKLKELGWKVIRFKNEEIFENLSKCVEEVECLMG